MKMIMTSLIAGLLSVTSAWAAGDARWTSEDAHSRIAFGSVKKDAIGEVHHFNAVKGDIAEDGTFTLMIDLSSVDTGIDIRNERIRTHVFADQLAAKIHAQVDLAQVEAIAVGDTQLMDFQGTLAFVGIQVPMTTQVLVARLSPSRLLVTSADFMMLSTEQLGINPGVDKLMELAKLPSITRATPVSVRMIFSQ